jgi:dipeptidyl-peptidase-3
VYKDPRGIIGSFEANVSFRTDAELVDQLSRNALYFEGRMPWKDAWKRTQVNPPVAEVVNVLVETGDGGPITPAAYNLPNSAEIRREHGSKNVMLMNVENAKSPQLKEAVTGAFYLPQDQDLVRKYGDLGRQWLVYLHEIVGHGSGQPDASLKGEDPAAKLGPVYSSLEECRADAVALYQFLDPKLVEMGVVKEEEHLEAARGMYLSYLGHQLMTIGELQGDVIREAHDRGSQLILGYLTRPGADCGVAVEKVDGKVFVRVQDVKKARAGVGEILARLQAFKSMGDRAGALAFFDQFGTRVEKDWQKDLKARLESINRPKVTAFVFPQLTPVLEERAGREVLKDVVLETRESFAEQQLRFKKWSASRDLLPR